MLSIVPSALYAYLSRGAKQPVVRCLNDCSPFPQGDTEAQGDGGSSSASPRPQPAHGIQADANASQTLHGQLLLIPSPSLVSSLLTLFFSSLLPSPLAPPSRVCIHVPLTKYVTAPSECTPRPGSHTQAATLVSKHEFWKEASSRVVCVCERDC